MVVVIISWAFCEVYSLSCSLHFTDMAQDVWQKLSYSNRPLDRATKVMLKVELLAPANAVLMKSIEDDCCNEEFLKMYFGNKKTSGAGVNVTVEITGRGEALISFENLSGECRVQSV